MIYGHSASQALFRMEYDPVLRFLSYSISQKLSGFRLKSTAGMTECGDSLKSNIDEFVNKRLAVSVRKGTIFRPGQEIKGLRGTVHNLVIPLTAFRRKLYRLAERRDPGRRSYRLKSTAGMTERDDSVNL